MVFAVAVEGSGNRKWEQMGVESPEWRQKVPKKSRTNPRFVRFPSQGFSARAHVSSIAPRKPAPSPKGTPPRPSSEQRAPTRPPFVTSPPQRRLGALRKGSEALSWAPQATTDSRAMGGQRSAVYDKERSRNVLGRTLPGTDYSGCGVIRSRELPLGGRQAHGSSSRLSPAPKAPLPSPDHSSESVG